MNTNIERYRNIILRALEIQQIRHNLKKKLDKLSELLTAKELKQRDFDDQIASYAFKILPNEIVIKKELYVKSSLTFKNTKIYLHTDIDKINGNCISNVLKEISITDILGD